MGEEEEEEELNESQIEYEEEEEQNEEDEEIVVADKNKAKKQSDKEEMDADDSNNEDAEDEFASRPLSNQKSSKIQKNQEEKEKDEQQNEDMKDNQDDYNENIPVRKRKKSIILVPDSDNSQHLSQQNDDNMQQNKKKKPWSDQEFKSPLKYMKKTMTAIQIPKSFKSQSPKKKPTPKWRTRPALKLLDSRKKSKRKKKALQPQNDDNSHCSPLPFLPHFDDQNEDEDNDLDVNDKENRALQQRHCNKTKKKRKSYDDRDDLNPQPKKMRLNENKQQREKRTVIMAEKETQTQGPPPMNPQQIEAKISQRFELVFKSLFQQKMKELKQDNDEWRQFLREKVEETTMFQTQYNAQMKRVQNEIFGKFRKDIVKKWKSDCMDIVEQLDEYASNIQQQQQLQCDDNQYANPLQRTDSSELIINQISSLLNEYNNN